MAYTLKDLRNDASKNLIYNASTGTIDDKAQYEEERRRQQEEARRKAEEEARAKAEAQRQAEAQKQAEAQRAQSAMNSFQNPLAKAPTNNQTYNDIKAATQIGQPSSISQPMSAGITQAPANYNSNVDGNYFSTGNYSTNQDAQAYYAKRDSALNGLSASDKKLLNDYVYYGGAVGSVRADAAANKVSKKDLYNALQASGHSPSTIEKLIQYQKEIQNAKDTENLYSFADSVAQSGAAGNIAAEAASLGLRQIGGWGATIGSALNNAFKADKTAPTDTNSPAYSIQNLGQRLAQNVGQNVYESSDSIIPYAAYVIADNAANNLIGRKVKGRSTLPTFFAESYAQTLKDNQEKGTEESKAQLAGLAAGAAEVVYELIPFERYAKLSKYGSKELKGFIKETAIQAGIESGSELLTDVTNYLTDYLINQDLADIKNKSPEEIRQGLIMTALVGGVTGAGSSMMAGATRLHSYKKSAPEMNKLLETSNYREFAEGIDTDPNSYNTQEELEIAEEAKDQALKLAEKAENGEKIAETEKGALYQFVEATQYYAAQANEETTQRQSDNVAEEVNTQSNEVARNGAQEVTVPSEYTNNVPTEEIVSQMSRATTANELAEAYKTAQMSTQADMNVVDRELGYNASRLQHSGVADRDISAAVNQPTEVDAYNAGRYGAENTFQDNLPLAIAYNKGQQDALNAKTAPNSKTASVNGENVTINKFNPDGTVDTSKGIMSMDAIEVSSPALRSAIETANAYNYSPALRTEYLNGAINSSLPGNSYNIAAKWVINGAKTNYSMFDLMKQHPSLSSLDNRQALYDAAVMEEYGRLQNKKPESKKNPHRFTGVQGETSEEMRTFQEIVSERAGVSFDNREMAGNARGSFNDTLGRIIVNSKSNTQVRAMLHEAIAEYIEAYNAKDYADIRKALVDYWKATNPEKFADTVARYQKNYEQSYKDTNGKAGEEVKLADDAINEIVNDAIADIMSTDEGIDRLVNHLKEKYSEKQSKTILQKIVDFLNGLADKFKELASGERNSELGQEYLDGANNLSEIVDKIISAWDVAVENRNSAIGNNKSAADEKFSIENRKTREAIVLEKLSDVNDNISSRKIIKAQIEKNPNYFDDNFYNVINGKAVAKFSGDEFSDPNTSASEKLKKYFDSLNNTVEHDVLGKIELTDSSIQDIISHGITKRRMIVLSNAEATIKNSKIFDYSVNWKDRGYDTTSLIALVDINGKEYAVTMIVRNIVEGNKFYVEDVIEKEKALSFYKTGAAALQSSSGESAKSTNSITPNENNATTTYSIEDITDPIDTEYVEAVNSGDEETQDRIIEEAAKEAGYNTPKLYSGTNEFGYTEIDFSKADDGFSYWTSSNPKLAATYTDGDLRSIGNKTENNWKNLSGKELADYAAKELIGFKSVRYIDDEEFNQRNAKNKNELAFDGLFVAMDYEDSFVDNEVIPTLKTLATGDPASQEYEDAMDKLSEWSRKGSLKKYGINAGKLLHTASDLRADASGRYVFDNGQIQLSEDQVKERIEMSSHKGIYSFYGKTDGFYEFDAEGKNWNKLGELRTTRDHAKYARDNGYRGAIIRNVVDDGGRGLEEYKEPGDIYIFFNETDVKSADPITYDDEGKIILPSERFKEEKKDIRYSIEDMIGEEGDPKVVDAAVDAIEGKVTLEDKGISDSEKADIKAQKAIADEVKNVAQAAKGKEIPKAAIYRISQGMLDRVGSSYDKATLQKNLEGVFTTLANNDEINYEDFTTLVREIARPVIQATYEKDAAVDENITNFKKELRTIRIVPSENEKNELAYSVGTYGEFFRHNKGRINLVKENGISIDQAWPEILDLAHKYNIYGLDDIENSTEMLAALSDAIDNYSLLAEQGEKVFTSKGDEDDAAYDLGMYALQKYFEQVTLSDKVNKEARKLIREANQKLKDQVKLYKAATDQEFNRKVAEIKAQYNVDGTSKEVARLKEQMAILRAKNKESALEEVKEMKKSEVTKSVKRTANQLYRMLTQPNDKRHVPDGMQKPLLEFINSIDFVSHRADPNSKESQNWTLKMNNLRELLNIIITDGKSTGDMVLDSLEFTFDPQIADDMAAFIKNYGEYTKVSSLPEAGLRELNRILTGLRTQINKVNETYANKTYENRRALAQQTMEDLSKLKERFDKNKVTQAAKNYMLGLEDAITYFEDLGTGAKSVLQELIDGWEKKVFRVEEGQKWFEDTKKELGITDKEFSKWSGEKAEVHTISVTDINGGKHDISFNDAQIMELYALSRRKQAQSHLDNGIIFGRREGEVNYQKDAVHLSSKDMQMLFDMLSPKQKALTEKMQQYLSTECGEWMNNVTKKAYGYSKANDKFYWPIKVDPDANKANDKNTSGDVASLKGIVNMSFTKEIEPNAKNAIMVNDAIRTFTDHVTKMATYENLALPVMDAMGWYNYAERYVGADEEGARVTDIEVKKGIHRVLGKEGQQWFLTFMKDLNGASVDQGYDGAADIVKKMVSNMKGVSVMGNVRVVIQQPTAIARATLYLNPIDLAYGVAHAKRGSEKAQSKSAIALWKHWGYWDTFLGQSMKNVITGQSTVKERINEKASFLAQWADDMTWGALYEACESEIKKTTDLKPGTSEFDEAVIERYNEVIYHTQVVDTVFTKPSMLRSKNQMVQAATAFMMEPVKNVNMIMRAFNNKDKRTKALAAIVFANILTSVVASLWDAVRDDDDETSFLERYLDRLLGFSSLEDFTRISELEGAEKAKAIKDLTSNIYFSNLVSGLNPMNWLPFIKEINSSLQGFTPSRTELQGLDGLINASEKLVQYIMAEAGQGKTKYTAYGITKLMAKPVSMLTGIPIYSAWRDLEAISNEMNNYIDGWDNPVSTHSTSPYYPLWNAVEKDKDIEGEVKKQLENGKDKSGIKSTLKNQFAEEYKADLDVDPKEAEELWSKVEKALSAAGYDKDEIAHTKQEWKEGRTLTTYTYVYDAIEGNGDIAKAVKDVMAQGNKKGNVATSITNKYKPKMQELYKTDMKAANELKQKLLKAYQAAGYSFEDANKKINEWIK